MAGTRERLPEFDILRWTAILAVVFVHVTALSIRPGDQGPLAVANQAVRFAVPAFVFIAAGLAWTRPPGAGGYRGYLLSRARAIVLPYAVFSLTYSAIGLRIVGRPWSDYPLKALANLLTGEAWSHLYFVPVAVTVYLLAPIAARAVSARPLASLLGAWALALVVAPALLGLGAVAPASGDAMGYLRQVASVLGTILLYGPYAAAGAWYVLRRPLLLPWLARAWPWVLGAGALAGLPRRYVLDALDSAHAWRGVGGLYVNPVDLALVLGLAGAFLALAGKAPGLAARAGRTHRFVYGVYLAHPLLVFAVLRLATRAGAMPVVGDPFVAAALTLAVLAVTVLFVRVLGAWRATAWVVGLRPPEPRGREQAA